MDSIAPALVKRSLSPMNWFNGCTESWRAVSEPYNPALGEPLEEVTVQRRSDKRSKVRSEVCRMKLAISSGKGLSHAIVEAVGLGRR